MNYWTNAPDWVNFIAFDDYGRVWGFEQKPMINYNWKTWMPVAGLSKCLAMTENPTNWENSLEERPKNQNGYNWDEFPEWANFAATDFNGDVCVSELKPQIVSGLLRWIPGGGDDERYKCFKNIGETQDWENSLEERPKNQNA